MIFLHRITGLNFVKLQYFGHFYFGLKVDIKVWDHQNNPKTSVKAMTECKIAR